LNIEYQELGQEADPIVRANIAQALAEAAMELAQLERSIDRTSAA
jgi:hypothetical protein